MVHFTEPRDSYEGWWKFNANYWRQDHRSFLEFFFSQAFSEPHSTKPVEDAIAWGLDTTAETLVATAEADGLESERARQLAERLSCPSTRSLPGWSSTGSTSTRRARSWPVNPGT